VGDFGLNISFKKNWNVYGKLENQTQESYNSQPEGQVSADSQKHWQRSILAQKIVWQSSSEIPFLG